MQYDYDNSCGQWSWMSGADNSFHTKTYWHSELNVYGFRQWKKLDKQHTNM